MYLGEFREQFKRKLLLDNVTVRFRFDFKGNIFALNDVNIEDDKIILTLSDKTDNNEMVDKILFSDANLLLCVSLDKVLYDKITIDDLSIATNSITLTSAEYSILTRISV